MASTHAKSAAKKHPNPGTARSIKTKLGLSAYETYKKTGIVPAGLNVGGDSKSSAPKPTKAEPIRVKPEPKSRLVEGARIESSNSRRPGKIVRKKNTKDGKAAYLVKWDAGGMGILTPDRIIVMSKAPGAPIKADSTNAGHHYDRMKELGIRVDVAGLTAKKKEMTALEKGLNEQLRTLTKNPEFNPRSAAHINAHLESIGQAPLISANVDAINSLVPGAVGRLIVESRQAHKQAQDLNQILKRTTDDGKIHADWVEAATGRWYTGDPPIQTLGAVVREFLVPEPGNAFYTIDWQQQELRIIAELTGEQSLKDTFAAGGDPHILAYEKVTGKKLSDDPDTAKEERGLGKMLNYALTYGLGASSLAFRLGISQHKAEELISGYFDRFPALANWIKHQKTQGIKDGYITTVTGRKIPLDMSVGDPEGKSGRQAVNYNMQGSSADQLVRVLDDIRTANPERADMIRATIHDALLLEVPIGQSKELADWFADIMRREFYGVQPEVDINGPSPNWLHAMDHVADDLPDDLLDV